MDSSRMDRGLLVFAAVLLACASLAGADTNRWTSIGPTANGSIRVHNIAFGPNGAIYVAGDLGIQRSTDAGATWIPVLRVANAYPGGYPAARYAAGIFVWVDPDAPTTLLAGLSPGGVYRSTDAGLNWTQVLYGSTFLSMAVAPSSSSTIYACVSISSEVTGLRLTFRSTDGGTTWTPLDSFGSAPALALAVDPHSSDVVYAAVGTSGPSAPGIYRSADGGASWTALAGGLVGASFNAVTVDPTDPSVLYAGATDTGIFRSADGGTSWVPVNNGLAGLDVSSITIDAQTPSVVYAGTSGGAFRSADSGAHWVSLGFHEATISTVVSDPVSPSTVYAAMLDGLCRITLAPTVPCAASSETLCLSSGRFRVELTWRGKVESARGIGQTVPISGDTGYFWFFDAANVELVLKVLDGTDINGAFWVFYGALSDLEYVITVTDGVTGAIQSYISSAGPGYPNSEGDTTAFPGAPPTSAGAVAPTAASPSAAAASTCLPDPAALCLEKGRFQVRVDWQSSPLGPSSSAAAVPLTGDTGYFWFFDDSNVELVVKVLDGTAINGHYWVFYGSLSDVQFEIAVTDTVTGQTKTYVNQQGRMFSIADTLAFPE